jgi:hypothetical protein
VTDHDDLPGLDDQDDTEQKRIGPPAGNQNATVHGGAGAWRRIQTGQELIGLAAQVQHDLEMEVAQPGGWETLIKRQALRMESAAYMYWGAYVSALEAGNYTLATSYVKVWCWIQASAHRAALAALKIEDDAEARQLSLDDVLDVYQEGKGDDGKDKD